MSSFNPIPVLFITFLLVLSSGCSKDSISAEDELYLTAKINGEEFLVSNLSGNVKCEKFITARGTVNLSVNVESVEGETIEFLILNYRGEGTYTLGDSFLNRNWIKYRQSLPFGEWKADNTTFDALGHPNSIDVTADNGSNITGVFSFEGYEESSLTRISVSDGDFNVRIGSSK